jgi:hypothetical protein
MASAIESLHSAPLPALMRKLSVDKAKTIIDVAKMDDMDFKTVAPLFVQNTRLNGDITKDYGKIKDLPLSEVSDLEVLIGLWFRIAAGRCAMREATKTNIRVRRVYEAVQDQIELLLSNECGLEKWASSDDFNSFIYQIGVKDSSTHYVTAGSWNSQ